MPFPATFLGGITVHFIRKPSLDLYPGIRVYKDTVLEYHFQSLHQKLENLVLHTTQQVEGDTYTAAYDTCVTLREGDVLIFEPEGRGYIKPVEAFVSVAQAISELENIKDLGDA